MTHSVAVEMQTKCRRLFYAKIDFPAPSMPAGRQILAGDIIGVASGGGAIAELTGDDLIVATYNDHTAPDRIGCIEEYYNPVPPYKPLKVDLGKVQRCHDTVSAHRTAKKAEADFVSEHGIKLFGGEHPVDAFRDLLRVQEIRTRDDSGAVTGHDMIIQIQSRLTTLSKSCSDCGESLLEARDAAVTFKVPNI